MTTLDGQCLLKQSSNNYSFGGTFGGLWRGYFTQKNKWTGVKKDML